MSNERLNARKRRHIAFIQLLPDGDMFLVDIPSDDEGRRRVCVYQRRGAEIVCRVTSGGQVYRNEGYNTVIDTSQVDKYGLDSTAVLRHPEGAEQAHLQMLVAHQLGKRAVTPTEAWSQWHATS